MKKKIEYSKAPKDIAVAIAQSEKINDFLPGPDKLATKEKTLKVTLTLSKNSVDFFKAEAKRLGYPYQRMIKNIVDLYAKHYKQK